MANEENPSTPFQWNVGAWFGSQIGGTLWLLVGAVFLLLRQSLLAAGVWAASFVAATALGLSLWSRRDRLSLYTALQWFLCGLTLLSITSMVTADWCGQLAYLASIQWQNSRGMAYVCLLVFPALMVLFWLRERYGLKGS